MGQVRSQTVDLAPMHLCGWCQALGEIRIRGQPLERFPCSLIVQEVDECQRQILVMAYVVREVDEIIVSTCMTHASRLCFRGLLRDLASPPEASSISSSTLLVHLLADALDWPSPETVQRKSVATLPQANPCLGGTRFNTKLVWSASSSLGITRKK